MLLFPPTYQLFLSPPQRDAADRVRIAEHEAAERVRLAELEARNAWLERTQESKEKVCGRGETWDEFVTIGEELCVSVYVSCVKLFDVLRCTNREGVWSR